VVLTMAVVTALCLTPAAQSAQTMQLNVPCPQYGVNRSYGGGWATMSVIRRGQRASNKGPFALYEVLIRINYNQRALVDRSALIVQGSAFATYGTFGNIKGYKRDEEIYLRPSLGKPNPYYVHTTVTVKIGSTITFAGAAANGPQLVFWGPVDGCLVT
jgi:hypothetical protein